MAKQKQTVYNPTYGNITPLQAQLLSSGSNPQKIRDAVSNLSLLGGLDENVVATVLQRSGSLGEQQAILDAIQEGRYGRYGRGSGGKGSGTPHFGALPVENTGDIIFESGGQQVEKHGAGPITDTTGQPRPSFQSLFDGAGPSEAVLQELANRQAMQDEAEMEARARSLGTIASRTGSDAQAARQILGIPATPGFEELMSPEQDRVIRTRMAKEAAQRAQIEKWASQPHADQANIENLWRDHEQMYPEFAGGQRPQTRAEQIEQMNAAKLQKYQQAVPDMPLDYDEKGKIGVLPGWAEATQAKYKALEIENDRLRLDRTSRDAEYKRQSDILDAAYPDGGPQSVQEKINLYNKFYGPNAQPQQPPAPPAPPEQGSNLPVNQEQLAVGRQKSESSGLPLVVDQDDYDIVAPGAWYIDAETGEQVQKQTRGAQ